MLIFSTRLVLKIAIAIFSMGLMAILAWFWLAPKSSHPVSTPDSIVTHSSASSIEPAILSTSPRFDMAARPQDIASQVKAVMARRPDVRMDYQTVAQGLQQNTLSELADPKQVFNALPWLTQKQRQDGRQFIAYKPYVLETKFVGDQLDILIPDAGITARGIVDSVEVIDQDIVRWQGHFENFNDSDSTFTITQTLTDNYAVGEYKTPIGNFNLEAKNGYGWVINQNTDFYLPKDGKDYLEDH